MKGLKKIPSVKQIARAYEKLQGRQKECLSCYRLSLYSQWSRLDPRLGELLIKYISQYWEKIHPIELKNCLQKEVWPAAFGVILDHVSFYFDQKKKDKALFRKWAECVLHGIEPARGELFFVFLYQPGHQLMYEEALYSLKIYKKWGYLASDLMFNKFEFSHKALLTSVQREEALKNLLQKRKVFKVKDYLRELNFQIPIKQAQRDLKRHPRLFSSGNTRNKIYFKKS